MNREGSTEYLVLGTWYLDRNRLTADGPASSVSACGRSASPKFASLKGEETERTLLSQGGGDGLLFPPRERSECWGESRRSRGGGSYREPTTAYPHIRF